MRGGGKLQAGVGSLNTSQLDLTPCSVAAVLPEEYIFSSHKFKSIRTYKSIRRNTSHVCKRRTDGLRLLCNDSNY